MPHTPTGARYSRSTTNGWAWRLAVVVAEVDGAAQALALVEELELPGYYLFHAVRAELLRRLGRMPEAAAAYEAAIGRCGNAREKQFLEAQLQAVAHRS